MHKKIEWPVAGDYNGERELEVAWIRRKLSGIKNKSIADFGGINYGSRDGKSKWRGIDTYGVDASNHISIFDKAVHTDMAGEYVIADIMDGGFSHGERFDIGVCISVLEHVGINCEPEIMDGDLIALRNIYNAILPGGSLFVTVPVCNVFGRPAPNIRVYTPNMLKGYASSIGCDKIDVEYFRYIPDSWHCASTANDFDIMCGEPIDQRNRRGVSSLACVEFFK